MKNFNKSPNKFFNISDLRDRIILQNPIEISDNLGGKNLAYSDLIEIWAYIEYLTPNIIGDFGKTEHREKYRIIIRNYPRLSSNLRILFNDKILNVISYKQLNVRFTEIIANEIEGV